LKYLLFVINTLLRLISYHKRVPSIVMSSVSIWFTLETIHFMLGSIGCIFQPNTVIQCYSLKPAPISNQAVEMVHVLAAFYVQNTVLCGLSIQNERLSYYASLVLFIFYYLCLLYDIGDIVFLVRNHGENDYPINYPRYRWFDTFLHIVFGIIHTIYFAKGRFWHCHLSLSPRTCVPARMFPLSILIDIKENPFARWTPHFDFTLLDMLHILLLSL
jgi:hypothetical protein